MSRTGAPAETQPYVYRYYVTASDTAGVGVGTVLIDKRRELQHTWEMLDRETEEITYFHGVRFGPRVCAVCYRQLKKVTDYGHAGGHEAAEYVKHDYEPAAEPAGGVA